jgi:glycosyltransferase involved in cell wall biosynthesis
MKKSPRLMVISQSFAPQVSGSPVLLANLLSGYEGDVSAVAGFSSSLKEDPAFKAPCPTVYFRPPRIRIAERGFHRVLPYLHWAIRLFIKRQIKRWQPDIVMLVCPNPDFLVPAYRVCKELGVPYYVHMHDLWQENYPPTDHRRALADRWEAPILGDARRVLCMTQVQADHYHEKYGRQCDVLPHTIPAADLAAAPKKMVKPGLEKRTVLFVGNVSPTMNVDSLRVLAKAADLLPDDVELLFCTPLSTAQLRDRGIESSRLVSRWVTREEVRRLLSSAHVLVSPLSHKNGAMEEVRTVFSTKLLEYLVSGRPILVFSPPTSFHTESAKQGHWGLVVDEDDATALATGIRRLLDDEQLAASVVAGALEEAQRRAATIHARRLFTWVVSDTGASRNDTAATAA